jgi:hypothetical protein
MELSRPLAGRPGSWDGAAMASTRLLLKSLDSHVLSTASR